MKTKKLIKVSILCISILIIISSIIGIYTYKDNHSKFSSTKDCCICYDCPQCDVCCSCDNILNKIIKGLKYILNENKIQNHYNL